MPLFITKFWPFPLLPLCFYLLISCFFGSFIYAETFLNCRILDRGKRKSGLLLFITNFITSFALLPSIFPLWKWFVAFDLLRCGSSSFICCHHSTRSGFLHLHVFSRSKIRISQVFCISNLEMSLQTYADPHQHSLRSYDMKNYKPYSSFH